MTGDPSLVVLMGHIGLAAARAQGLEFEGDEGALLRLQPAAERV